MISHTYKCIFVHIPKCAGTSLESVIWPDNRTEENLSGGKISKYHNKYQTGGLEHLLARQIRQEVGEETYNSYYKFSIVRNPWDRTISQYIYMKSRRRDLRKYLGVTKFVSLAGYLKAIQKIKHVQWESQYKFIEDDDGKQIVDHVGRFENLDVEFQTILKRIGLPETVLPHRKKSQRAGYQDYYNQTTRDLVASIYKEDIERFGYSF